MTIDFTLIAKLYLTYMLCALPAKKEDKRPTVSWKVYQDTLPTESEWDGWGIAATAICILTGKISGNLLVIDFDDKGSRYEPWRELIPKELLDRLVVVQTQSGGYHVYVRYNDDGKSIGNVKLARTVESKTLIETRGVGGLVIAPPTPGYEICSGSFESIPVLSRVELELLLESAQSFDATQKKIKSKSDSAIILPPEDIAEAERRVIAYINAMPEAVEGCNGSADAMRVANKLYEFGLDLETAKQIFMEYYNPRCIPEWSEKEIDHKLDTAYNKPFKEFGSMLETSSTQSEQDIVQQEPSQHFPTDALPLVMYAIVKTIANAHAVPEAFVAYPALSHMAAALGNQYKVICYPDGGSESATLWTGVLADSGTGKTEVLKKLRVPFDAIENRYYEEIALYKREKEAGNDPPEPQKIHLLVGDATMEGVFVVLRETEHGLLLSESEGKLFFTFDIYRKGKTDEANYCKLYDGERFKITRKGDAPIEGFGTMNVAMMIQPINFEKALATNPGMATSGLLARMNLCYPTVGKFDLPKEIDNTPYSAWNDTISRIIDNRFEREGMILTLKDDAKEAWNRYMVNCRNLARQTKGWLGAYYDRLHVTALRIAIQIHYFEGEFWFMNLDAIERGIAIAEYMKCETERIVGMLSGDISMDEVSQLIKSIIQRRGGEATVANFRDGSNKIRTVVKTDALKQKLQEMVIAKTLTVRVERRKGHDVGYYSIRNPLDNS